MTLKSMDISDYQDAIEDMLMGGEALEGVFPASSKPAPDSDDLKAIAVTSERLIVCSRVLKVGSQDHWTFRSIPFALVEEVELLRHEDLRHDEIRGWSAVTIRARRGDVYLHYADSLLAREVHDLILEHILVS